MHRLRLVAVAALLIAPTAATASDNRNNWHIHDGRDLPGHKPIGFFDDILTEGDTGLYLQDPAACPDATDKALLPGGGQQSQPVRSGICRTSAIVIHLRTIENDAPAPEDWEVAEVTGTHTTYYRLTDA